MLQPLLTVQANAYQKVGNQQKPFEMKTISQLGFCDGVVVLPFDSPSFDDVEKAPYAEYELEIPAQAQSLEVRTLANLHVYEGRDARVAIQIDANTPEVFDIHADDFSAEWRWNVLRGYASKSVSLEQVNGKHTVRVYLLDPGIVLQELCIH